MKIGEPFNPYKLFHGAYIPNWLLKRPEVSHGAKLCYGRLIQYSGKHGQCFPSQGLLAEELGVLEQQARRYVKELKDLGLLRIIQHGLQKPNGYLFLCHDWMSAKVDQSYMTGQDDSDLSNLIGGPVKNDSRTDGPNILLIESEEYNHSECSNLKKEKEKKSTELYSLYPRKVGRAGALKAIGRALGKVPFLELKAKVQAFAAAWVGATKDDFQYCPYPQTWFNDERYLEDPKEWERRKRNGNGAPIHKQIEALESLIAGHRCNPRYVNYAPTPELQVEYKQAKAKLAELQKQQSQAILAS